MYDDVIERSTTPYKRIILASDGEHPCINAIKKKWSSHRRKVSMASKKGDLFTDACALLGARNVAWGRSGFSALFMMLNPNRDQVYLPLAHPGPGDSDSNYLCFF